MTTGLWGKKSTNLLSRNLKNTTSTHIKWSLQSTKAQTSFVHKNELQQSYMSSYRTFNKAKCLKMKPNNYSQQQLRTQSDWQFTLDTKPNNRMRKPKDTHLKPFDSHQALSIWKQKLQVKEKPSTLISLENTTLPIINTNLIKQPVDTVENQ